MKDIVFNGPFSMGIMEDSTDLSETIMKDVCEFVKQQYGLEVDKVIFSVSSQVDLDREPKHHNQNTMQKLKVKKKNDKIIAHLIIKSNLKCD